MLELGLRGCAQTDKLRVREVGDDEPCTLRFELHRAARRCHSHSEEPRPHRTLSRRRQERSSLAHNPAM